MLKYTNNITQNISDLHITFSLNEKVAPYVNVFSVLELIFVAKPSFSFGNLD